MMKKYYIIIALAVLVGAGYFLWPRQPEQTEIVIDTTPASSTATVVTAPITGPANEITPTEIVPTPPVATSTTSTPQRMMIPAATLVDVPFVPQAPYKNWDALHQESCEEASMIMANLFSRGTKLSIDQMEQEIQALVKWQADNGYQIDATAQETKEILKQYYQIDARLESRVSVERIKYELAQGHSIIVPAAGRLLGNPNFTGAGPVYHMLVIRGYDQNNFITNDPGTRKGEKYEYRYDVLLNAIHDWDHQLAEGGMTDEEIIQGRKIMLVIER